MNLRLEVKGRVGWGGRGLRGEVQLGDLLEEPYAGFLAGATGRAGLRRPEDDVAVTLVRPPIEALEAGSLATSPTGKPFAGRIQFDEPRHVAPLRFSIDQLDLLATARCGSQGRLSMGINGLKIRRD